MIALLALKTALGAAWGYLNKLNPLVIIIALLTLSSALLWHNASGWKAKAVACDVGRKADRANYTAAQAESDRVATKIKHETEARDAQKKKDADDALKIARADGARHLADWMRQHATAQSHSSGPDLPETSPAAGIYHGTTPAAAPLACFTEAELKPWDDAYARLANAHDWGQKQ